MNSYDIDMVIISILDEKSFESKMKLARAVGYEKLTKIVEAKEATGVKVPHVIKDVLGSMRTERDAELTQVLEDATPEQMKVLVRVLGYEKCNQLAKRIKNPAQAHMVRDYTTPMEYADSVKFVTAIEETAKDDYQLAQQMVTLRGVERTQEDIERTEKVRPVKHIVADVMGPLSNGTNV